MRIIQKNRLGNYNGLYYIRNYYSGGDLGMVTKFNDVWNGLRYDGGFKTLGYQI